MKFTHTNPRRTDNERAIRVSRLREQLRGKYEARYNEEEVDEDVEARKYYEVDPKVECHYAKCCDASQAI